MTNLHDTPERDETDLKAAEYVLGVLPHDQRASLGIRLKTDPEFARAVEAWTQRLSGLNDAYDEAPAPDLIRKIERRLFGKPARKPRFWRSWFTGAVVATALGLGVLMVMPVSQPLRGFEPVTVLTADAQPLRYEVTRRGDELRLSRVAGGAAASGQVHELWLIAGSNAPVSLGLIAGDQVTLPLPVGLLGGVVLAISLEPAGGSPTGAPTGPVLVTGVVS